MITSGSSTALAVPEPVVDYVFVDPPFGKNILYADLAFLAEAWHGVLTAMDRGGDRGRHQQRPQRLADCSELMVSVLRRVLPRVEAGRWMTVEFSNHSNDVWRASRTRSLRPGSSSRIPG